MSESNNGEIIGFYASFNENDPNLELFRSYLWGKNGLKNELSHLKWRSYGQGLELILFQFYVNPGAFLKTNLKQIESYRSKEKSIGIPVIIDNQFFNMTGQERQIFFSETIISRLELVKIKVKRNKLRFEIIQLIEDVKVSLNYKKTAKRVNIENRRVSTEIKHKSIWQKMKDKLEKLK